MISSGAIFGRKDVNFDRKYLLYTAKIISLCRGGLRQRKRYFDKKKRFIFLRKSQGSMVHFGYFFRTF